jgi:hypothetical protein
MSSSVSTRQHSFPSQFLMSITIVVLLVAFSSSVSSSPTPSSPKTANEQNNKINYESNGFMFDPSDFQATSAGDSSVLSPTVQQPPYGSSPFWYVEPRTNANQFLMSHINDNDVIIPKWFTKLNNYNHITDNNKNNDDDDLDDYAPSVMLFNKRSTYGNNGGYSNVKKRKQLTKPPMEVMNEIVNSIYLRR